MLSVIGFTAVFTMSKKNRLFIHNRCIQNAGFLKGNADQRDTKDSDDIFFWSEPRQWADCEFIFDMSVRMEVKMLLPGDDEGQNQHFQHPHQQFARKLEILHFLQGAKQNTNKKKQNVTVVPMDPLTAMFHIDAKPAVHYDNWCGSSRLHQIDFSKLSQVRIIRQIGENNSHVARTCGK